MLLGVIVVGGVMLLPFAGFFMGFARIYYLERQLAKRGLYEPVADYMITACQSDQRYFNGTLPVDALPASLGDIQASSGSVTADAARIEFGGGFHHFGYAIKRDDARSNSKTGVWEMELYSEDAAPVPLGVLERPRDQLIPAAQLAAKALARVDQQLASSPTVATHLNKARVLLACGRADEARALCRGMHKKVPPTDVRMATLVAALLGGEGAAAEGGDRLIRAWAATASAFVANLELALYFHKLGRTAEEAEALRALVDAPCTDQESKDDLEYRLYGAAYLALQSNHVDLSRALCAKYRKLSERKLFESEIQALEAGLDRRSRGEVAEVPRGNVNDPFETYQVDIDALAGRSLAR